MPGEIANNDYARIWGVKEVYYGICASRELTFSNYFVGKIITLRKSLMEIPRQ